MITYNEFRIKFVSSAELFPSNLTDESIRRVYDCTKSCDLELTDGIIELLAKAYCEGWMAMTEIRLAERVAQRGNLFE
ncbi:MAG: hypothetical protein WC533_00955 [Candidatus Pacearchaeota archaeon]